MTAAAPMGLLAELTHRCPLQCPYCSNPLDLVRQNEEMSTEAWADVFRQASEMGVLQLHLSGGEPMARGDIEALVKCASSAGLYTNLITSGVTLDERKAAALREAGLDHVQISIQGADAVRADRMAGSEGAMARKTRAAAAAKSAGLALTVNAVMHKQNLSELPQIIALAIAWGAERLEVAHVQYYGWGLANLAALLPSREATDAASATVVAARVAHQGRLVIDYVVPDYHAERPKACMGGWGQQIIVIAPDGAVMPCHAARTIPDMSFDSVRALPLRDIWERSEAFLRFRGTGWMKEPCRGCPRAEIDWGGCRCQAMAIVGDAGATDPACGLSPHHGRIQEIADEALRVPLPPLRYRRFGG